MSQSNTRYFAVAINASGLPMALGLCVPDVCDHAGVSDLVHSPQIGMLIPELMLIPGKKLMRAPMSPQMDLAQPGAGYVAVLSVLGFLALLVVISTAVTLHGKSAQLPMHQTSSSSGGQRLLAEGSSGQQSARQYFLIEAFSLIGKSGTLKTLMDIP